MAMPGSAAGRLTTPHIAEAPTALVLGSLTLGVGALAVYRPLLAFGLVLLAVASCVVVRTGVVGVALITVGALPWLTVFDALVPRLTATLVAAAAVGALLVLTSTGERVTYPVALQLGLILLFVPIALSLAGEGSGEQLVEVGKYVLFPAMAIVLARARPTPGTRTVVIGTLLSAAAALVVHLMLGLVGVGSIGTYYGSGELLVYANPHHLALLASCVAAGSIRAPFSINWRVAIFATAAVVTIATGVRSALAGLLILVLATVIWSRARKTALVLLIVAVGAVFWTGVQKVAESRYQTSQSIGEFNRFETVGSNRGQIWSTAVADWRASGPDGWFFGTGLRSIPKFEIKRLGQALVGHSDVVQVGVELGVIGLLGLLLIWISIVLTAAERLPLLTLGAFGALNGSLEYSGPIVVGLTLCLGIGAANRLRTRPEQ
jgi:hypothetical protein